MEIDQHHTMAVVYPNKSLFRIPKWKTYRRCDHGDGNLIAVALLYNHRTLFLCEFCASTMDSNGLDLALSMNSSVSNWISCKGCLNFLFDKGDFRCHYNTLSELEMDFRSNVCGSIKLDNIKQRFIREFENSVFLLK